MATEPKKPAKAELSAFSSDLTFITNESGKSLRDRFVALLSDDTRLFDCLGKAGINIHLISTSEIKIAVIIDEAEAERAAQLTHQEFGLAALAAASTATRPLGA